MTPESAFSESGNSPPLVKFCKRGHNTSSPDSRHKDRSCKVCKADYYATPEGKARADANAAAYKATPKGKATTAA